MMLKSKHFAAAISARNYKAWRSENVITGARDAQSRK